MGESIETDYEEIGHSYYCIYCAGKIEPHEHYHDGGFEGTTYECTCEGSHEATRIKDETEKLEIQLETQLDQLTKSSQSKLDKHRYDAAVKNAAYKFHQPIPKK